VKIEMPFDHSPGRSHPSELAAILAAITAEVTVVP
jgi:hypothetical protein